MLVTTREEKSLVLQTTFDTQNTKVWGLHFENNLTKYVIGSTLVELKSLQQKVDFQTSSVQTFKVLLQKGSIEHARIQAKSVAAEERWKIVVNKLDMRKWRKVALLAQVQSMKNGNHCLILKPSLIPFIYLEMMFVQMFLTFCQFCLAHFAIEALSLSRIARLHFTNMLTIPSMQLPIFPIFQNACWRVVKKRCIWSGGHY